MGRCQLTIGAVLLAMAMSHGVAVAQAPTEEVPASPTEAQHQGQKAPGSATEQPNAKPHKPNCDEPNSIQEAGLCEQRRMTKASEGLLARTDRQIWLSYWQLGGLLASTLFTAIAAVAAAYAARAAGRAATIAERGLVSVERAFVFARNAHAIPIVKPTKSSNKTLPPRADLVPEVMAWRFIVVWENSGSTPTQNMFTYKNLLTFDGAMPDDFAFPDLVKKGTSKELPRTFIGPKAIKEAGGIDVPISELREVASGKQRMYMWGWAEWSDVFSTDRSRSEFCFEIEVDGDVAKPSDDETAAPFIFRAYKKHNGTAGECYRQPGDPIPMMET